MNRKSLPFCVALCLSILAAANAALADPGQQFSDRIEPMKLGGWQEVAEGVLQRTLGSRVETVAFGEKGMRWSTERIKERVGRLQEEYNRFPSEDLANLIENLQAQLTERERSLRISQATAEDSLGGGGETMDACAIYDATADAYPLTGSSAPGTGATAYARWYSDCGHVGNTYAYAYARATKNGTQTTHIVEDPQAGLTRSGTNITSNATASAPGSTDCFSEAFARSWNDSLNIDYSAHDTNFDCPLPNPDTPGVFRNGTFFLRNQNSTGIADLSFSFGASGDQPVAGDWNGDGIDTIGVFRNGTFYLRNSNSSGSGDITVAFGAAGDQPIVGDWNGDGIDTVGFYRNSGVYLRNSNSSGLAEIVFSYGLAGDVAIVGDWDGNGTDTIGVFRPSNGTMYLKNSNSEGIADVVLGFGASGSLPVAGDWNGDGVDTVGVYHNGTFYLRNTNTSGPADLVVGFGLAGDLPIVGDWNGLP